MNWIEKLLFSKAIAAAAKPSEQDAPIVEIKADSPLLQHVVGGSSCQGGIDGSG